MKIAVIGEKKLSLTFHALGAVVFGVENESDVESACKEIEEGDYGVVFITEDILREYSKSFDSLYGKALPAVLSIPGLESNKEKRDHMGEIIERALGSKLPEDQK